MSNLDVVSEKSGIELQLDKLLSELTLDCNLSEGKRSQDKARTDFTGAQLVLLSKSQPIFSKAYGSSNLLSESGEYQSANLKEESVYDLGSLTRIIATAPILYLLVHEGLLSYQNRISRYLPSFSTLGKERMTIENFISHTSGLPSSINLSRSVMQISPRDTPEMSRRVAQDKLLKELLKVKITNLPGRVSEDSQLGYIILAYVIEQITGLSIDKVFRNLIAKPLGLKSLDYIDWEFLRREKIDPDLNVIVPTKICPWRNKMIHGECLDELAWYLSGVSTHSGLFGDLKDLSTVGQALCDGFRGVSPLFSGPEFKKKNEEFLFDKPSAKALNFNMLGLVKETIPGSNKSDQNWYGLDGDTGVSLWINPEKNLVLVLATNQIQKSKDLKPHLMLSRKVKLILSESF